MNDNTHPDNLRICIGCDAICDPRYPNECQCEPQRPRAGYVMGFDPALGAYSAAVVVAKARQTGKTAAFAEVMRHYEDAIMQYAIKAMRAAWTPPSYVGAEFSVDVWTCDGCGAEDDTVQEVGESGMAALCAECRPPERLAPLEERNTAEMHPSEDNDDNHQCGRCGSDMLLTLMGRYERIVCSSDACRQAQQRERDAPATSNLGDEAELLCPDWP